MNKTNCQGLAKYLSGLALMLWVGQANATMVTIFESQAAAPGDEITLDVNVSDLGGDVVTAYTMTVLYDTQYLAFEDVVFTSESCISGSPSCADRGSLDNPYDGSITLDEDLKTLEVFGSSEPMTLATLTFTVLEEIITDTNVTVDTSTALINKNIYRGNSENFTTGFDVIGPNTLTYATITSSITTSTEQDQNVGSNTPIVFPTPTSSNNGGASATTISVAAIPEPSTLALLGLGLAGLGFTRRRIRA